MQPSDYWDEVRQQVTLYIFDTEVEATIQQTETGDIEVELENRPEIDMGGVSNMSELARWYDFQGQTEDGAAVTLKETSIPEMGMGWPLKVNEIDPSEVIVDETDGEAFVDTEVTFEFEMASFRPYHSFFTGRDGCLLIDKEDWSAVGYAHDELEDRVEHIKQYYTHVRTGTIELKQRASGTADHLYDIAMKRIGGLSDILSFVQGIAPTPIQARLTEIDGNEVSDNTYVRYIPNYRRLIGNAFGGHRIWWARDLERFLSKAYDEYIDTAKDRYLINVVISWYLDAINTTRTVESQHSSLASGIELLAKRHSDRPAAGSGKQGPLYNRTRYRIHHLVNELNVRTDDLANYAGTYERPVNKGDNHQHYFYSRSRQKVIHGDNLNRVTNEKLLNDYHATRALLERLIRNQLVGDEGNDKYDKIGSIERYTN